MNAMSTTDVMGSPHVRELIEQGWFPVAIVSFTHLSGQYVIPLLGHERFQYPSPTLYTGWHDEQELDLSTPVAQGWASLFDYKDRYNLPDYFLDRIVDGEWETFIDEEATREYRFAARTHLESIRSALELARRWQM